MKPGWLVFAFAGGVAVGVLATRIATDTPAISATVAVDRIPAAPATNDAVVEPAPARPQAAARVEAGHPSGPPPASAAPPDARSVADGDTAVQHIDVGAAFNEQISRPSQPGFENQLGDAHRALERETRNDGWAYTMEAEIQNAMVNEVSTGEFRADHVECRATLCEVRLSGKGDQAAAIKHWSEGLGAQPFGQRLFMNYSSTVSSDERVDSIMILQRPPASPPPAPH